jgi:hypothetical protein
MRTRWRWDIKKKKKKKKKKKAQDCWFDDDAILKRDAANGSEIVPSLC